MDEWVGWAVVGKGVRVGVCVWEGCAPDVPKAFSGFLRNPWRRLACSPSGRPGVGVHAGRSQEFLMFFLESLATSGVQPPRSAGGEAALWTSPWIRKET